MVYTEFAPRWQQFHLAPAMQQPKSAISTPLPWILKDTLQKGYAHSESHVTCTVSLLKSREQHYIKAINNNNNNNVHRDRRDYEGREPWTSTSTSTQRLRSARLPPRPLHLMVSHLRPVCPLLSGPGQGLRAGHGL